MDKHAGDAQRSYSCLMAIAPESLGSKLQEWADNNLDPEDIVQEEGKGVEKDSHVTVLYGLHTKKPEEVFENCDCQAIPARCGGLSLFQNDDADVLKLDIDSPELHALNGTLREKMEYTNSYDDYVPHMTVAYLKPGTGQKYLVPTDLDDVTFTMQMLDFSDGDRNHTYKRLPLKMELDKAAYWAGYMHKTAAHPALPDLKRAKAHSDRRQYDVKSAILRKLLKKRPGEFVVDSDDGKGILGLTHKPTGFQIHIPREAYPQQKAAADKRSDLPLRERVEVIATKGDKVLMQKIVEGRSV